MAKKRLLILSFTQLLRELRDDTVKAEELGDALFYFSCTRGHALNPGKFGEISQLDSLFPNKPEEGRRVHRIIVEALMLAVRDGRSAFREREDEVNTYEVLNRLLNENGYSGVDPYPYTKKWGWGYHPCVVALAVSAQEIPLKVIYSH